MNRLSLAVLVMWLTTACSGGGAKTCAEGCPSGARCDESTNLCVRADRSPAPDAGHDDAGAEPVDGGVDAGDPDAGIDAGVHAGGVDAGDVDAGRVDAGEVDAGEVDAGAGGGSAGGAAGGLAGGSAGGGSAGGSEAGGSAGGATAGGSAAIPAPVFTLTTPAMGVAVAGPSFELRGSFTESMGREVVSANLDVGDGVARPVTLMNGAWRVTVPLPPGLEVSRTFTLTAQDVLAQATTVPFPVLVDTLGPRATLTAPTSGAVVGAMARLEGLVVDPATPIMSVTVDLGMGPQLASVAMNGAWQVDVSFPANLDRVQRPVTIGAVDALGNSSAQLVQVLVDTQGPALSLVSPSSTTAVGAQATLSGTAADSTGAVTAMTVDVGAGPLPVTVQPSGAWSLAVTFPPNLDRVNRTVTLRAQDALGNVTQTTAQVLVDTQGPALAFSSPAMNERLGVPRTQPLAGSVSDGSGVVGVTMDCADGLGSRATTVTGMGWAVSWPLPSADHVSFVCAATATDSLGNTRTVSRSFFVDTVAPALALQSPAVGALLGGPSQGSVSVTAALTDGSNLFGPGTATLGSSTVTAMVSASALSATVPLPLVDFQSLTLSVTVTDAEGNSATATRQVTVDRVAPVLSITAPTNGQTFNIASVGSGAVTLSWTMSDGDPSAEQRLEGVVQPAASRSAMVSTSPTDNGVVYTRTLSVTDRAGNSATSTRSFSVDRVAPAIVATTPANGSRMVNPRTASVTFSEQMSTSTHALTGVGGGTWNGAQTTWTSNALGGATVYTAQLNANAVDLAGNPPAAAPSWVFHTAPVLPPSGTLLATNVRAFDAASDLDGTPFVGFVQFGNAPAGTATLNGVTGTFEPDQLGLSLPSATYQDVHVQVHSQVNASLALVRTRSINGTGTLPPPANFTANVRRISIDDAPAADPTGVPVVSPPIEAADGTAAVGNTVGTTYVRFPLTVSLAAAPEKVIPGNAQWAGFSFNGSLRVSHRQCGTDLSGSRTCGFTEGTIVDGVASTVLKTLSGAVSNTGCFIYAWDAATGRRARIFGAPATYVGGSLGLSFTSLAAPGPGFAVARRTAGGHYAAWETGANSVQLSRTTTPTLCTSSSLTTNWTTIRNVTVPTGVPFRVIELGAEPAVIYLDNGDLRLVY